MADGARASPSTLALAAGAVAVALFLAGCASGPRSGSGGALSGRDGPGANPPSNLASVPDAEPRIESIRNSGGTSKPYNVLGRSYEPITDDRPFRETGLASWYGRKFHAASTSSGEPYDMYAMTAAHKTLPLPSYVRVRNPANGREVIVRVNDRGPFVDGRVIDLSYTAALKLDLLRGVAPVEIERITNDDIRTGAWRRDSGTAYASAQQVTVPSQWIAPVVMSDAAPGGGASTMPVVPQSSMAQSMPAPPPYQSQPDAAPQPPPPRAPIIVNDLPPLQAAPSQPPPLPAGAPAPSGALQGFWVQLGAFREVDGAESLRAQAERAQPSMASQLRVFSEAGTHRLQAGPFASRSAASDAAAQLKDTLRLTPMVVERR